jgi:hypothetical protein
MAPMPATPAPAPQAATGEAGRRVANAMRSLREAERVAPTTTSTRFVAGHSLSNTNGTWIEDGIPAGARVLRVRAMARSYFTLLRLRPELREVLSVGTSVRFRLDANRVIEVGPDAADTSDADIESFLR